MEAIRYYSSPFGACRLELLAFVSYWPPNIAEFRFRIPEPSYFPPSFSFLLGQSIIPLGDIVVAWGRGFVSSRGGAVAIPVPQLLGCHVSEL